MFQIMQAGYLKGGLIYFDFFDKLYHNSKLPHAVLLSGIKGLGKATFAYHFINYLLSYNENN